MKIISVHIPKAGGLTFFRHLEHIYGEEAIIMKGWNKPFGHEDYEVDPPQHVINHFAQDDVPSIAHGHFLATKFDVIKNAKRIIWFRNPVERVCSHYHFWKVLEDKKHPCWLKLHENDLSLVDFAKLDGVKNHFSMFLDGTPLTSFDFIGLVERFDESLRLFYKIFAVNVDVLNVHENKNELRKKKFYDIDDDVRQEIEEINRADMGLYKQAIHEFEKLKYYC